MANSLDPVFTPKKVKEEEQNQNNESLRRIIQTLLDRIQKLENK